MSPKKKLPNQLFSSSNFFLFSNMKNDPVYCAVSTLEVSKENENTRG